MTALRSTAPALWNGVPDGGGHCASFASQFSYMEGHIDRPQIQITGRKERMQETAEILAIIQRNHSSKNNQEEMKMTERQLTKEAYQALRADLLQSAHRKPYCPIYERDITLNGECCTLFIQLDRHNKVYLLYALRATPEHDGQTLRYELIINGSILAALMELLIHQVADKAEG